MRNNFFSLCLLLFFSTGCSIKPYPLEADKVDALAFRLSKLSPLAPKEEAMHLAKEIYEQIALLTQDFKLTSPPKFHNTLVNIGLRKKGLCYDWSDSIYLHLRAISFVHYSFHLLVSSQGSYLFEHNALAVTAKKRFEKEDILNGILIDAWRDSGRLYTIRVKDDKAYKWKHRTDRCLSDYL